MESVSDVIKRNGKCLIELEAIPGGDAYDCDAFLKTGCLNHEGPCTYRDKIFSAWTRYNLGD